VISETGTGFARAKLSEILPAARDARFVRMTQEARAALGVRLFLCVILSGSCCSEESRRTLQRPALVTPICGRSFPSSFEFPIAAF